MVVVVYIAAKDDGFKMIVEKLTSQVLAINWALSRSRVISNSQAFEQLLQNPIRTCAFSMKVLHSLGREPVETNPNHCLLSNLKFMNFMQNIIC